MLRPRDIPSRRTAPIRHRHRKSAHCVMYNYGRYMCRIPSESDSETNSSCLTTTATIDDNFVNSKTICQFKKPNLGRATPPQKKNGGIPRLQPCSNVSSHTYIRRPITGLPADKKVWCRRAGMAEAIASRRRGFFFLICCCRLEFAASGRAAATEANWLSSVRCGSGNGALALLDTRGLLAIRRHAIL